MSPKKSARRARPQRVVKLVPWTAEHAELFRLASALGAAPLKVKATIHSAGYTFEAKFLDERGNSIIGVTRVRRDRQGKLRIVEERTSLRFAFRMGPKAEAAAA